MKLNFRRLLAMICALWMGLTSTTAQAEGANPFLGQIMWVPYNFAPRNWASCDGQLLPIAQNTALFSLLGTQYGGNGQTTFALPDMRGRLLIGQGQGAGLSNYQIGQSGGAETHTLTPSQMPAHNHSLQALTATATATDPTGKWFAQPASAKLYGNTASAAMSGAAIGPTGGGQPHNNMMPFTTLHCIIATAGVFPSRP